MKALSASARSSCLALAVMLTLASCGSWRKPPTTLTPRSEAVCDSLPPAPLPLIPATHPELEAAHRVLIGLYRDEIVKYLAAGDCRAKVRAENAAAASAAK